VRTAKQDYPTLLLHENCNFFALTLPKFDKPHMLIHNVILLGILLSLHVIITGWYTTHAQDRDLPRAGSGSCRFSIRIDPT